MNRHKYADVINAWAAGRLIQFTGVELSIGWTDFDHNLIQPNFNDKAYKWRIKPITLKYRVALMEHRIGGTWLYVSNKKDDDPSKSDPEFVTWISKWTEVTV